MKNQTKKKFLTTALSVGLATSLLMPVTFASANENNTEKNGVEQTLQQEGWNVFDNQVVTSEHKTWKISVNQSIDPDTVNHRTVFVKDQTGKVIPTNITVEEKIIEVSPVQDYEDGKSYTLYIMSDVKSATGVEMKENVQLPFEIKLPPEQEESEEESEENSTENDKDETPNIIIQEVEVNDLGHGRHDDSVSLKTTVDQFSQKPEALVSYINASGRQAIEQYKSSSHDSLLDSLNIMRVSVDEEEFKVIKNNPNIEYIERNVIIEDALHNEKESEIIQLGNMFETESGDLAHWGYESLGLEGAVQQGITGEGVKIAILDTGISTHDDLELSGGVSRVGYTDSYYDDEGHGTHIAGIISAKLDGQGIVGVAPDAEIYSVKVVDEKGRGSVGDIALGIMWAMANDIDVINISIGSAYYSPVYEKVIEKATQADIVVVASAGNDGVADATEETILYPAKYDETIAVGAINEKSKRLNTSGAGAELDFVSPGERIVSTSHEGGYISYSGTSMAAPQITGMIALLKQAYPNKSVAEYKNMLINEAVDLGPTGFDTGYGYGLVSFENLFPVKIEEEDTDTEVEEDTDTEVEEDTDTEVEEDTDTEVEEDTDTEVEEDTDIEVEEDTDTEVEEDTDTEVESEDNGLSEADKNALVWATAYVEMAEKHKDIYYIQGAVKRVTALTDSSDKELLVERMQALGYMLPEDESEYPESVVVNPEDLSRAEKSVERAEQYDFKSFMTIAIDDVMWLPASYERDQLLKRLHALGELLDVELSGLPKAPEDYEGAEGVEDDYEILLPDPSKSFEYNMANRYVTNLEIYGSKFYEELAMEYTLALAPSTDRDGLLKRLHALGFALDVKLSE